MSLIKMSKADFYDVIKNSKIMVILGIMVWSLLYFKRYIGEL